MRFLIVLAALPVALLVAAQLGALSGRTPSDLGATDGRLKPPSLTRNSVSSQADLHPDHPQRAYARIDPLPFKAGGAQASIQALEQVLSRQKGVRVVRTENGYLYAQATTPWLKFTDDLEFLANGERSVIELRSASRLGSEDFGVNRERIEALRTQYLAQP